MPNYTYSAVNSGGKVLKGTVQADRKEDAVAKLKARGIFPTSVEEANALNSEINIGFLNKKPKPKDLSVFCRQMNSILSAGVQMTDALDMLGEQTENKSLANSIRACRQKIAGGVALSEAMQEQKCFEGIFATMVAAGESSGNLEMAFDRMAEKFEKDTKMKSLVKKSTMYPIVLAVVTVVVIVVMLTFVVPKFQDMLSQLGTEMPALTQFVIDASEFVKNNLLYIIIGVVAFVFAFRKFKATNVGKHILGKISMKVPLLGPLTVRTACSNTARTLATLLAAGLPMLDALEITADTMTNIWFKEALLQVKKDVSVGATLSEAMTNCNMYPPMLCHMAKIGEETGNIVGMFDNTADYYDQEVQASTEQVTAAMEPMVIVVMAGVVGTMVIALLMPMISMYGNMDNM